MRYKVYYRKDADFKCHPELTLDQVLQGEDFAFIRETTAKNLEDLFTKMQGEVWSPNGEARELIRNAGCDHTSMSVGDVAVDEEGNGWQVNGIGWKEVPNKTEYIYYIADDETNCTKGNPEDDYVDVYEAFLQEYGHAPDRVCGVIEETPEGLKLEEVWTKQ